jgi:hypothetical protein
MSAAVLIGVIGLVPLTGLAHHPVAEAARQVGGFVGVIEGDAPPPAPTSGPTIVTATQVTAAEASELLGATVMEPIALADFELTSSQYFPEPITSDTGGTYVLTYHGMNPAQTLVIYQELASGAPLFAPLSGATSLILADGNAATYVEGGWEITDGNGLSWDIGNTQTLIFEHVDVRTIIRYTGPPIETAILTAIGNVLS